MRLVLTLTFLLVSTPLCRAESKRSNDGARAGETKTFTRRANGTNYVLLKANLDELGADHQLYETLSSLLKADSESNKFRVSLSSSEKYLVAGDARAVAEVVYDRSTQTLKLQIETLAHGMKTGDWRRDWFLLTNVSDATVHKVAQSLAGAAPLEENPLDLFKRFDAHLAATNRRKTRPYDKSKKP